MALPLPDLDDRRFSDLVAELRALIPHYDRSWTNHNPADPGMTLLELFAWLSELLIYRLNKVDDRRYLGFLRLLGVEPSAPKAILTFTLRVPEDSLPEDFEIPRGTRVLAVDASATEETTFETTVAVPRSRGFWHADSECWVFKAPASNVVAVTDEYLGRSDGKPNQELTLSASPLLDGEGDATLRLDFGSSRLQEFTCRRDLLESGARDRHFVVEPLARVVRFGDGAHGVIPEAGAEVYASYRRGGDSRGNVPRGAIRTLADPGAFPLDAALVGVTNEEPASGGVDSEGLDDLLTKALLLMLERSRAVSQDDFESLALESAPGRVARARAVFGRNLVQPGAPRADGHVSLLLLPSERVLWADRAETDAATLPLSRRHTPAEFAAALHSSSVRNLCFDVQTFLEPRRLLTTVLHVVPPAFTPLALELNVEADSGVALAVLEARVAEGVARFLDPHCGWIDGCGWPFGRAVYRAELYQLIEGIEGVDHVTSLRLNGDPRLTRVEVGEFGLVGLSDFSVRVGQGDAS